MLDTTLLIWRAAVSKTLAEILSAPVAFYISIVCKTLKTSSSFKTRNLKVLFEMTFEMKRFPAVVLLGTRGIGDWHRRIGRAGAWRAHAPLPRNFNGWAEIHASFGQNIKIPEKLWYIGENFWMFAKIM